jgi:hypothetical protein
MKFEDVCSVIRDGAILFLSLQLSPHLPLPFHFRGASRGDMGTAAGPHRQENRLAPTAPSQRTIDLFHLKDPSLRALLFSLLAFR